MSPDTPDGPARPSPARPFYRRDPAIAAMLASCALVPVAAVVPQRLKVAVAAISVAFLVASVVLMALHRRPRPPRDGEG